MPQVVRRLEPRCDSNAQDHEDVVDLWQVHLPLDVLPRMDDGHLGAHAQHGSLTAPGSTQGDRLIVWRVSQQQF